ncbi:protein NRT1/ PTR FAMILY 5.8-like isoform X2 [Lolium rigidum]|uniref:protein NRT1/ PTR FAMILY 5.8-like isoform X2 n=1 Tax=Lolium rigidum TaxID=89674 RepID=UPI001F5D2A5E|nr:protein NRT1/ PTR FAMILY 5.8-like isoform X2 [Lolium rigidum]
MMTAEKGSSTATLSRPCVLIIVVAGVERFAFKGVASNMVTYLTDVVKMSTSAAAMSVSTWAGITSMLPLVSAILADSYWDRYSTIIISSLLYVTGLIGLTSWALFRKWMPCSSLFLPLYLISIGQGGYNPSLQAFGADQLDIDDEDDDQSGCSTPEEKGRVKSAFFQWWYFGICCGSLLGNSTMSYVQDTVGWGIGFAIPSGAMAISVVAFFCCTPLYKQKINQPRSVHGTSFPGSILRSIKSLLASVSAGKIRLSRRHDDEDGDNENNFSELELQGKALKVAEVTSPKDSLNEATTKPSVAKIILRLLPIWTVLLMFAVIFQQPMTFFTKQGALMDHEDDHPPDQRHHREQQGDHGAPADWSRHGLLRRRHGHRGARRVPPAPPSGWPDEHRLAPPAVRAAGGVGRVHRRGDAGVLLHGGPQRHEDHRHRALPQCVRRREPRRRGADLSNRAGDRGEGRR